MAFTLTFDHGITADEVVSWAVSHSEGDFATLEIVCVNPRVGLLSGALFATFAWNGDTLFYGRLVGVPEDINENAVKLVFLARPDTYDADKLALAETLKVAPYWDPVWIAPDQRTVADTVLEARAALWHIDRVTHDVTISSIITGEAGTVVIDPETVPYGSVNITFGETPAESINCKAEIHWRQKATGEFSLTQRLYDAFEAAGSLSDGYITTYTGQGLVSSWPKIGTSIGGGWSVGNSEVLKDESGTSILTVLCATGGFEGENVKPAGGTYFHRPQIINVVYGGGLEDWGDGTFAVDGFYPEDDEPAEQFTVTGTYAGHGFSWKRENYYDEGPADTGGPSRVGFQRWSLYGSLSVKFDADRERVETIDFTINADVQPLVSAREDANLSVELSTSEVDQPIDPGGLMPIGDIRRNSYLITDRGQQSLAYLISLCRARLLARARAVQVSFSTTLEVGAALTLRHSVSLSDPRLPGGIAVGKVVALTLSFESGLAKADVTMACTIGRGNTLTVPTGTAEYVDPSYFEDGYQIVEGQGIEVEDDIYFLSIYPTEITEDETNLFSMTAETAVESLEVFDGSFDQLMVLIGGGTWHDTNAAVAALDEHPTRVELTMVPVTGDAIVTPFEPEVSDLMVPKTIDLE